MGLIAAYRRTGADVPFGDPVPSHDTEMEGWFWRFTDASTGRVVIALCSVNRHPAGDWSTVAVGVHPGGIVRAAALDGAAATDSPFTVRAGTEGDSFTVETDRIDFQLGDLRLQMEFADPVGWPKMFGGGGIFSAIPFLNQYWHPWRLGGTATGTVQIGSETMSFDNAKLYCERNWGAGFPERWWWGQAHDFGDDDVCVAFSVGRLELGPIKSDVAGIVVRIGRRVIRLTPPMLVRSHITDDRWVLHGRSPRYDIRLEGDGNGRDPHVLPVPLPVERRNIDSDFEHLAGRLRCTVKDFGRLLFDGASELAALEIGSRPPN